MGSLPPPPPPPPPSFYKAPLVSFALLLPLLIFMSSYSNSLTSIFLTILVLVLFISLIFIFSMSKQLQGSNTMEAQREVEVDQETQMGTEMPEQKRETRTKKPACSESVDQITPCSDSFTSFEWSLQEIADQIPACSEGSISDDESLIEIALPDGHPMRTEESEDIFRPNLCGFLPEISQELVLRQHGLMELLAEISEEDNLIEIDISMGSIKCSRLGIKA